MGKRKSKFGQGLGQQLYTNICMQCMNGNDSGMMYAMYEW